MRKINVAIVGCGSISDIYMTNIKSGKFEILNLVACSDLMVDRMNASAEKFGIKAMTLDEICADESIEMVINLTTPAAHYPIIKQCLLAGKHVFSEKMIAVDLWQGKELVDIANEKGLQTCIIGGIGNEYTQTAQDIYAVVKMELELPKDVCLASLLLIGYPTEDNIPPHKDRKSFDEIVSFEKYSSSFVS